MREKREEWDGDPQMERQIITGMIMSPQILREVQRIYREGSLVLPYAATVARWCLDYFEEFKEAPQSHIQDIYRRHKDSFPDESKAALIEEFLCSISSEFVKAKQTNEDYMLKGTEEYFRSRAIYRLEFDLKRKRIAGKIEEAESLISGFTRVARPITTGVDPFRDMEYVADAFNIDNKERMFALPGDLGRMIGPFHRGWFGMIVGSTGRGKTWWLMEIAMRALHKGYNVAFVSMEMTEKQMIRRFYHWIMARPSKRWAGDILLPRLDCVFNQDGSCSHRWRSSRVPLLVGKRKEMPSFSNAQRAGYIVCIRCRAREGYEADYKPAVWYAMQTFEPIDLDEGMRKAGQLSKYLWRGAKLKLLTFPAKTLSIRDLRVMMANWENYEGWNADLVITDYADKMASDEKREKERRHVLEDISSSHKGLALEKNALVFSASQSNTSRDEERDVGSGDFAEAISKKNEIDVGCSLNQLDEEKRRGIMRVKNMKQRHDDFSLSETCMVLQQLKIGKPYITSCLLNRK